MRHACLGYFTGPRAGEMEVTDTSCAEGRSDMEATLRADTGAAVLARRATTASNNGENRVGRWVCIMSSLAIDQVEVE